MKIYNQPVELIVSVAAVNAKSKTHFNLRKQLTDAGVPVEAIVTKSAKLPVGKKNIPKAFPITTQEKRYVITKIKDSEMNPWDIAHLASKGIGTSFVEPDIPQEFIVDPNIDASYKQKHSKSKSTCFK